MLQFLDLKGSTYKDGCCNMVYPSIYIVERGKVSQCQLQKGATSNCINAFIVCSDVSYKKIRFGMYSWLQHGLNADVAKAKEDPVFVLTHFNQITLGSCGSVGV